MGAPSTLSFVYGDVDVGVQFDFNINQLRNINYEHAAHNYQDFENNNLSIDYMTTNAIACGQGNNSLNLSLDNHSKATTTTTTTWIENKELGESTIIEDSVNLIRYTNYRDTNNNISSNSNNHKSEIVKTKENQKKEKSANKKKVQHEKEIEKKPKSNRNRARGAGGGGGKRRGGAGDEQLMRRPRHKTDAK